MTFDEKITEIMRNIGIAENTLMAAQLEIDALEARATAAEAEIARLIDRIDERDAEIARLRETLRDILEMECDLRAVAYLDFTPFERARAALEEKPHG